MEDRILEIMKRTFLTDEVDTTSSQKNCQGWDSLHHLDMVIELENEFGISFEPEEIASMIDFDEVVRIVISKL